MHTASVSPLPNLRSEMASHTRASVRRRHHSSPPRLQGVALFLRSRNLGPALLGASCILFVVATPLGDLLVPVGALTGTSDRSVAARTIVTLAVAAVILPIAEQPLAELESTARRSVLAWQWLAMAIVVVVASGLMWAAATITGSSAEPLVRNALGLTGLALLARPWWGRLGWLAPLVWVMASVLFGYQAGIGAASWAWPIAERSNAAWLWATGCFVLGLASLAWTWARPARSRAVSDM